MPKITREGGVSDANAEAPAEDVAEDVAEVEEAPAVERPGSKAVRQDWLDWAAASGYHGPCADVLTVPQIQALPDGPPVYDEDGLLVTPDDASDETRDAVERYNAQAIELFGDDASAETDGTLADGGVVAEADAVHLSE